MLVLARWAQDGRDEILLIDRNTGEQLVRIVVNEIRRHGGISIGIDAPAHLEIVRGELREEWDFNRRR